MDEGLSAAVLETFVRLHRDGLIYRGKRLVNWDPVLGTAVSDLEVESNEEDGELFEFAYEVADAPGETIIVATRRPETMVGDTAAGNTVNPGDFTFRVTSPATGSPPALARKLCSGRLSSSFS